MSWIHEGEWTADETMGRVSTPFVDDEIRVDCGNRTGDAVRLIAAAPALLAACKRLLRSRRENWNVRNMDFKPIDDVKAAIAKAEGRTNV